MDEQIAFNIMIALEFLNRIKASPDILFPIGCAIMRLDHTMELIRHEQKIETQKHLAFMNRTLSFSQN